MNIGSIVLCKICSAIEPIVMCYYLFKAMFFIVSHTTCVCSGRPRVMRTHDSRPGSLMNLIL